MAEHAAKKLALLEAFCSMYSSRIQVANEEYAPRFVKVAVVATVNANAKIVPDMQIQYLERDQFLERVDTGKAGVPGAISLMDSASDGEVPLGLIFDDGDALMMKLRVERLDRA